jgi:hypothetical protein
MHNLELEEGHGLLEVENRNRACTFIVAAVRFTSLVRALHHAYQSYCVSRHVHTRESHEQLFFVFSSIKNHLPVLINLEAADPRTFQFLELVHGGKGLGLRSYYQMKGFLSAKTPVSCARDSDEN